MGYSIQASGPSESTGYSISVDLSSLPTTNPGTSISPYGEKRKFLPAHNPFDLDRKKWGALLAESSDYIENGLTEEEAYRRQDRLDRALAKFSEAAKLANCLNKPAKRFFNILWTYLGNPRLLTDDAAGRVILRIIRNFAGHPNASEKDVDKYLSDIDDTKLEFTWADESDAKWHEDFETIVGNRDCGK
jgi:hypothetical protein